MKKFKCGLCKLEKRISMTRRNLRKHLEIEHKIVTGKTNSGHSAKEGYIKQKWWIEEEFK